MWNLKFTVLNKDSIYTLLTEKYKVKDYLYPVDYYKKGNKIFILGIHVLEGEKLEIQKFVRELKKNKKIKKIEYEENKVITLIAEEEKFYELLFSAELYHASPVVIEKGYETWNVSSFDRNILEKLITELGKWKTKFPEFNLQNLGKTNFNDIYFPKLMPQLPEKQKHAYDLALKNGYYTFPRKIDLVHLAKIAKVSVSTFQENLRKAEAKIMPFFGTNIGN